MRIHIKPGRVHAAVFCFLIIASGCRGVGEFAYDRLESGLAGLVDGEPHLLYELDAESCVPLADCIAPAVL